MTIESNYKRNNVTLPGSGRARTVYGGMIMTNQEFIQEIAPLVQKYTKKYGYGVPSAIIAQACLESAYGTSTKAKHHNYFGLKYRPNRVSCSSGIFRDGSQEQMKDGKYVKIVDWWFGFDSMEDGVEGYLQFIGIDYYAQARKAADPQTYLQALKDAGYATSRDYVADNMAVIRRWNLTKYDGAEPVDGKSGPGTSAATGSTAESGKSGSASASGAPETSGAAGKVSAPVIKRYLSDYNHESRAGVGINYIVLHYTGNKTDTAKANANYFAGGNRGASAHYFVDETSNYQSVDDSRAAWHCGKNYGSNNLFGKCTNKNSIGIEMCSHNGVIKEETIANAVALTRYLMSMYNVPVDRVVRHYDVCSKNCPGWSGWLPPAETKWAAFRKQLSGSAAPSAAQASADKSGSGTTATAGKSPEAPFLVQVTINDLNIRKGPGTNYGKTGKYTGKGRFTIVQLSADKKWGKLKSGAGWIYLAEEKWVKKLG